MSDNPKVSVVLPTYNRAHIISEAIESILNQSYQDFEIIVVDDGSTDNTKSIVDGFSDKRIRYLRHERNKGLAAGRNTGARAAKGKYIANQDSDDIWLPHKLAQEVRLLDNTPSNVGAVYSRLEKVLANGKKVFVPADNAKNLSGNLHKSMLEGNFITMQAILIKKECFPEAGWFDERFPSVQEGDFLLRVSKQYEFLYNPNIGVRAKISPDSITANQRKRLIGKEMLFNKHIDDFKKYRPACAKFSYSLGNAYSLMGDMKKGRKYLSLAFKKNPLNIKYLATFLLSLTGSHYIYKRFGKIYNSMKLK